MQAYTHIKAHAQYSISLWKLNENDKKNHHARFLNKIPPFSQGLPWWYISSLRYLLLILQCLTSGPSSPIEVGRLFRLRETERRGWERMRLKRRMRETEKENEMRERENKTESEKESLRERLRKQDWESEKATETERDRLRDLNWGRVPSDLEVWQWSRYTYA